MAASRFQIQIGGQWKDYAHDEDKILKMLFRQGRKTATITLRGQDYEYDFTALVQRNLSTGKVRAIRLPKEWASQTDAASGEPVSRASSGLTDGKRSDSEAEVAPLAPAEATPLAPPPTLLLAGAPALGPPTMTEAPRTTVPRITGSRTSEMGSVASEGVVGHGIQPPASSPGCLGLLAELPGPAASPAGARPLPEAPLGTIAATVRPAERPTALPVAPPPSPPVPAETQRQPSPGVKEQEALPEAPLTTLARSLVRSAAAWLPTGSLRSQAAAPAPEAAEAEVAAPAPPAATAVVDAGPAVAAADAPGPAAVPVDTLRIPLPTDYEGAKIQVPPTIKEASLVPDHTMPRVNEASLIPEHTMPKEALPIPERADVKTLFSRPLPNTTLPIIPELMKAAVGQPRYPVATKARVPVAAAALGGGVHAAGPPARKLPVEALNVDMAKVLAGAQLELNEAALASPRWTMPARMLESAHTELERL